MSLTTKVKVEKLSEKSYNKTVIDFNFGRHKNLSTLGPDGLGELSLFWVDKSFYYIPTKNTH